MVGISDADYLHHLYSQPGDLLPYCGVIPGPDESGDTWHTGHVRDILLKCLQFGLPVCVTCCSPAALSFSPLILDEDDYPFAVDEAYEEFDEGPFYEGMYAFDTFPGSDEDQPRPTI